MPTSLNGWPGVATSGPALRSIRIPGTGRTVVLEKTCAPLFAAFLSEWHKTVMPIDGSRTYLGPDGWEYRQARTGDGLSNHASGTAVDVRYDVLKSDHQRHMTSSQIAAVHRLLDRYVDDQGRRVFGWGGDWTVGTYCDEMHTELAQGWAIGARGRATTKTDVLAVIKHLGIASDGTFVQAVDKVYVGGRTPVTAREIARILGISWARVVRFNGALLLVRARPGVAVRIPPGVTPRPIYRGAPGP